MKLKFNKKKKENTEKDNVREEGGKDGVRARDRSRSPLRVSVEDVENNKKRKNERNDNKEAEETNANVKLREEGIRVRSRSPVSLEEEAVRRFQEKVVQAVKTVMNQYWPGAEEFTGVQKISTEEEYSNTARNLSIAIREKIKAGYKAFNRNTPEGISFTGDHALVIQTEVESFFEERPRIS